MCEQTGSLNSPRNMYIYPNHLTLDLCLLLCKTYGLTHTNARWMLNPDRRQSGETVVDIKLITLAGSTYMCYPRKYLVRATIYSKKKSQKTIVSKSCMPGSASWSGIAQFVAFVRFSYIVLQDDRAVGRVNGVFRLAVGGVISQFKAPR